MYAKYYMGVSVGLSYFFILYLGFFGVMWALVLSAKSINFLVWWELLGVVSFFLILWFLNWESSSGSTNALLVNHLGGLFLIIFLGNLVFSSSSEPWILGLFWMLLLVSFTKSAQLPFSGWLPMAMSAPTPVSSLVHSSTLVTAGLFLIWMSCWETLSFWGLVASLTTLFFSGLAALLEKDLKKLVALSTLSQISLCVCAAFFG